MDFEKVVKFHGHICPGLAMGYRVAEFAASKLKVDRADDEELVAIVENNSCAVDAIQKVLGCTFGKGNFIFKDYGKQVYTFFNRSGHKAIRVAVKWTPLAESEDVAESWQKFRQGDRSTEVVSVVNTSKSLKVKAILDASESELFAVSDAEESLPDKAQIYPTVACSVCGERCMEPRSVADKDGVIRCLPCSQKDLSK